MGRLIDPERRKRAKEESAGRRAAILEQARLCFLELPFSEITLELIARRAGTKAGFASMYFVDLHHLALSQLREELSQWFDAMESAVGGLRPGRGAVGRLPGRIARTLVGRDLLLRLLTVMPVLLEAGLSPTEVFTLLRWHRDRLEGPGRALERAAPHLGEGGGAAVLFELELQVAALLPLTMPRGSLAVALGDRQHAWLQRDLATELQRWLASRLAVS